MKTEIRLVKLSMSETEFDRLEPLRTEIASLENNGWMIKQVTPIVEGRLVRFMIVVQR